MISLRKGFKLSFISAFLCFQFLDTQAQKKPNIVLIISDDHAFQAIGAYGSKIAETPNLDRLAKEGVTFDKAYVTNSICGPSRAVMLTGKYSHINGFKDNDNSHFDHSQATFPKYLQQQGYQTAWIGKLHLGNKPEGFDYYSILPGQGHYYNPEFINQDGKTEKNQGYVSNIIEDKAEQWLDQREKDKPFCLVIGHKATHRTWIPDTGDFDQYEDVKFPLPHHFYDKYKNRKAAAVQDMSIDQTMLMGYDLKMLSYNKKPDYNIGRMNEAQREKFDAFYGPIEKDLLAKDLKGKDLLKWKYQRYMKDYLATAASLDRNIGRVLDYLDQNNLADNTVVIYVSDQGFYLGEHGWFDKRFMYEESFRTPMIMRFPGKIKPNSRNAKLILNLDIPATLLDIAGVRIPENMQGKSFMPTFEQNAAWRDAIYYHYYENGTHSVSPHFGISTGRYKLIRFYERVNSWELFDLEKDPHEMNNLYGKKKYQKLSLELKAKLKDLINQYQDNEALQLLD